MSGGFEAWDLRAPFRLPLTVPNKRLWDGVSGVAVGAQGRFGLRGLRV